MKGKTTCKNQRNRQCSNTDANNSEEPEKEDDLNLSDDERIAILSRLRFRQALVRSTTRGSVQDFLRSMIIMQRELETIKETHGLAKAVPQIFDEKVQRRLASTVPPRPVVRLGFDAALDQMKQLLADNLKAMEVGKTFSSLKEIRVRYVLFLSILRANRFPRDSLRRMLTRTEFCRRVFSARSYAIALVACSHTVRSLPAESSRCAAYNCGELEGHHALWTSLNESSKLDFRPTISRGRAYLSWCSYGLGNRRLLRENTSSVSRHSCQLLPKSDTTSAIVVQGDPRSPRARGLCGGIRSGSSSCERRSKPIDELDSIREVTTYGANRRVGV
jgi:hypothetical protein